MPRQSQNQSPALSRKKALISVAILLALTGVLVLLFQDHWAEISAALAQLSLGQVALVLALGIAHSQQAMQAERAVTDATNELLRKNAATLKQGTIEIAKESERGIVDIETLQQTNKQLIETLDELNKIRADGKAKRANAEQELGRIEGELRQKMLEINN